MCPSWWRSVTFVIPAWLQHIFDSGAAPIQNIADAVIATHIQHSVSRSEKVIRFMIQRTVRACRSVLVSAVSAPRSRQCSIMALIAALTSGEPAAGQRRTVDCAACHAQQAEEFRQSVHAEAVFCQDCHGGPNSYRLTPEEMRLFGFDVAATRSAAEAPAAFDHGEEFTGKASREEIPDKCGTCHANVEQMNPFGLRTDPLAAYWVSGHGKALKNQGDTNVAVCIDCHGTHDVLPEENPNSRVYFQNIPNTCGTCHADRALMKPYHLSADIVDQYGRSIHGRNVLENGDAGSPHCATCHGSHAAAPPGFADVGHVCGQCHQQVESYVLESVHGRIAAIARCTGCHNERAEPTNHEIRKASVPLDELTRIHESLGSGGAVDPVEFKAAVDQASGSMRLDHVCNYCHAQNRAGPHSEFFAASDKTARARGEELAASLRAAQLDYIQTKLRVDDMARGVLLVGDEALRLGDARTELMALQTFVHTLKRDEVAERASKIAEITEEVNTSLDDKQGGLQKRRVTMAPVWIFALVFSVLMFRWYLQLKHVYVGPEAEVQPADVEPRRRWLQFVLGALGLAGIAGLVWPAVAYVLPARKRGGGLERSVAGSDSDWKVWEARKVAVAGKPVIVLRAGDGFRAFSAICTHLGCIVHWTDAKRVFECPCHAASFAPDGKVISGPPPRPLPEYKVAVVQGDVIVTASES